MSNWIQTAHIQNFKSLRDVSLDCERVNVFVGKPNVGKSNLLEALSLLGLNYKEAIMFGFANLVRHEKVADLFYDQDFLDNFCSVETQRIGSFELTYSNNEFHFSLKTALGQKYRVKLTPDGKHVNGGASSTDKSIIKFYKFPEKQLFKIENNDAYLQYPYGENLLMILQTNKAFRQEASSIFEEYGLELLLDAHANHLEIVKRREGILFKTPYSLIADTLRRYLFHLAAVESNRDSVILFEEPEAHNFPPYIVRLAHRILESKTNQFFLTTHSPFLLNTLVEEGIKEVAVFLVEYEDFQTKVKRLSEENLRDMLDYGLDIFMNQEAFV